MANYEKYADKEAERRRANASAQRCVNERPRQPPHGPLVEKIDANGNPTGRYFVRCVHCLAVYRKSTATLRRVREAA